MESGPSQEFDHRRGLAIDLDGTLLDSMKFHANAWQRAFEAQGLKPSKSWFYLWEGVKSTEVIDRALALLDIGLEPQAKQQILRLKQSYFDTTFEPLPMPGLDGLFQTIQVLGYPVAIVTGSERRLAVEILTAIGFKPVVRAVIGGDDVERGKPAPDPYRYAVQMLQVPAANCLVLENAPMGIESALAAGMLCVAVTTTLPPAELQRANAVVRNLEQFSDFLLKEASSSGGEGAWQPKFRLS